MKICSACGISKPIDAYHKWRAQCKDCYREKGREYYRNNRQKRLEGRREYYRNNREKANATTREWRERNREHVVAYQKDYDSRRKRPTDYKAKKLISENAWARANPEKIRLKSQRRRARKAEVKSELTNSEWDIILDVFSYSCAYCGKLETTLEQDHIVPLSMGGDYTIDNIVPSCKSCNSSKKDNDFREWIKDEALYESVLTSVGDAMYVANMEV